MRTVDGTVRNERKGAGNVGRLADEGGEGMKPKERVEQNSYMDESGVVRCKTCKEPLFYHGFRALCKCEQEEFARGEEFVLYDLE